MIAQRLSGLAKGSFVRRNRSSDFWAGTFRPYTPHLNVRRISVGTDIATSNSLSSGRRGHFVGRDGRAVHQPEAPFISQRMNVLDAEKINIREKDGTLKAVLSNSACFTAMGGERAKQPGGVRFSGLLFYNQQGDEEGGLVYSGRATPGGQDADVTLTFDQYRQDQKIYLHHEEHKDAQARSTDD
jgi:hypothetical protein